ncbi:hypothetical protein ACLOJK_020024 [Asimina triloba]
MTFLFIDRGGSECNRQSINPFVVVSDLAPPFCKKSYNLFDFVLRKIVYEILVDACKSSITMSLSVKLEKSMLLSQQPSSFGTSMAANKMRKDEAVMVFLR